MTEGTNVETEPEMHMMKQETSAKILTLPDILDHFQHEFMDEINGANTYLDEAWAADEMHHYELEKGLLEMGKDEYTHARFIYHCLTKHGVTMTTEQQAAWDQLETRIRQTFR